MSCYLLLTGFFDDLTIFYEIVTSPGIGILAHPCRRTIDMLEILTDPFKRQLYDEGYDAKAIEERVAAAQRAAHENPNRRGHHH